MALPSGAGAMMSIFDPPLPYDRRRFAPQSKAFQGACSFPGCAEDAVRMRQTGNVRRDTWQAICADHYNEQRARYRWPAL